jgi:hypothetical protein
VLQDSRGKVSLCEIKSGKGYRRHSALNNLIKVPNYDFANTLVFCEDNVSCTKTVSYLPIYLLSFLKP